jgi:hypothetical protein
MSRLRTHNRRKARRVRLFATSHLVRSFSLRGWRWHQFKHLSVYRKRNRSSGASA